MANHELIEKMHADLQHRRISKKAVAEMVREIFTCIEDKLIDESSFSISSFGRLYTLNTEEKIGTHPQTQEPLTIPAAKRVRFKPSKELVKRLK